MATRPNPLIAAVLKEIPGPGSTRAQRIGWLKLIAMSMDNVYGVDGAAIDIPDFLGAPVLLGDSPFAFKPETSLDRVSQTPPKPQLVRDVEPPRFFIDHFSVARQSPSNQPITAEMLGGETIFDDRGEFGDLGSIQWADGRRGVLGLQINISATPAKKTA